MALTDNCDVFASVSENFINSLVNNVARQRPSLFNYGTKSFVAAPQMMCHTIKVAPALPGNQPLVTLEQPLPIPGTDGAWAFEWCAQLTKLEIDFHPGSIPLPPELKKLEPQSLALHAEFCAALACPPDKVLRGIAAAESDKYPALDPAQAIRGDGKPRQDPPREPPHTLPVDRDHIHCFCIEVFAVAHLVIDQTASGPVLRIELTGLEIVDIKPDGLEQSVECLIAATLSLGVLPRFRIALHDIILGLGTFGQLTIGLTPISAAVPFNPSIAQDQLSVFVDVDLT